MMKYGSSSLTLCKMRRCSLLVTSNPTKSSMCFLTPGWPLKRDPLVVVKGVGTRRNGHGRDTARAHHAHEKMKPTAAHSRRTDQNNAFLRTYDRTAGCRSQGCLPAPFWYGWMGIGCHPFTISDGYGYLGIHPFAGSEIRVSGVGIGYLPALGIRPEYSQLAIFRAL